MYQIKKYFIFVTIKKDNAMETDVLDYENVLVEAPKQNKFIEGFTPKQRYEYDRGIPVEIAFNELGKKYGFLLK